MKTHLFGKMPDGEEVFSYRLSNRHGASLQLINLGAVVQSLMVPDRAGRLQDVVLGCDSVDDYLTRSPYLGAIVGRYGNRIRGGRFRLDGAKVVLRANNGENHLHGGEVGFDKRYWEVAEVPCEAGSAILARLESPDGEEGYPGTVRLELRVALTDDNVLSFEYSGTTDRPTVLNPTHHGYFNLTGDPRRTILSHELQIAADAYTPVDAGLIPTGELAPVAGTPLDFRAPKAVGQDIEAVHPQLHLGGGYDHNFVLNRFSKGEVRAAARLFEPESGRYMIVHTDQPGLQLYSGNFLDGTLTGKGGVVYQRRCGICLEAQHHPDSPNQPRFPSVVLRPGEVYRQVTTYEFGVA